MTGFSDNALLELLTRFALTLLFNIIQMRIVSKHAPESRKNVYSFFIISVVVFFLANALGSFNMQIGMAIGMFAVFGIVRYRTEALRPQEMTYLFAAIGIAVINALSSGTEGWLKLVVVNTLVLAFIYLLERFLLTEEKEEPALQKVNVTLPVSELDQAVFDARIATLAAQMQVQVVRVHISKVDYALGTAQIQVYYEK
jgi:Ca2+/Na+ antiporter